MHGISFAEEGGVHTSFFDDKSDKMVFALKDNEKINKKKVNLFKVIEVSSKIKYYI